MRTRAIKADQPTERTLIFLACMSAEVALLPTCDLGITDIWLTEPRHWQQEQVSQKWLSGNLVFHTGREMKPNRSHIYLNDFEQPPPLLPSGCNFIVF